MASIGEAFGALDPFAPVFYLTALAAVVAHYKLGRLLGFPQVFTGSLVGASFSALIAGALANTCAMLVRPYLFAAILLFGAWSLVDWIRMLKRGISPEAYKRTSILLIAGLALFISNNPEHVFLQKGALGNVYMIFNQHYSYLSSQSYEMLNALYPERLRIASQYPQPWPQYHFFTSSYLALMQVFVPHASMFSYFIAEICLAILALLSIGEVVFLRRRASIRSLAIYSCWLVIGFSLFRGTIIWNLSGNAILAVWAAVLLCAYILSGERRKVAAIALILGASAFRLLPVAFLLLMILGGSLVFERSTTGRLPPPAPQRSTDGIRRIVLHLQCFYHRQCQPTQLGAAILFGVT